MYLRQLGRRVLFVIGFLPVVLVLAFWWLFTGRNFNRMMDDFEDWSTGD